MRIRNWFRRRKKEPVGEHAQRFDARPFPAQPEDILLTVLKYIEDMLSDKKLIPSYLRGEILTARRLPAEAWELARKSKEECSLELVETRRAAVEYAMRISLAILKAQLGEWRL